MDSCDESNQFCYTCEPPSEGTDLFKDFGIFPEPANSSTWAAATTYIESNAGGDAVEWHTGENLNSIVGIPLLSRRLEPLMFVPH